MEDIARLQYGIVPPDYKQLIPTNGSPPPAIIAEKKYFFDCNTVDAPGVRGAFQRIDNMITSISIKLPCTKLENGKQITVTCPVN